MRGDKPVDAFRDSIDDEVRTILGGDFEVIIGESDTVPSVGDSGLTYPNLDSGKQKCKLLESCILHVDIRDSTDIGERHRRENLVRLYSAFVRTMSRCAGHFGGKVRNIVGDRVMVLFDEDRCFTNAVNTAILMNSATNYVIDKHFELDTIKCGIGIDYGKMLTAKAGVVKRGQESSTSRSLVWLGRPANVASKLADEANKTRHWTTPAIMEGHYYPSLDDWSWSRVAASEFLDKLTKTYTPVLRHPDQYFRSFFQTTFSHTHTMPPILMTKAVFDGYKSENPSVESIKNNWWAKQNLEVTGYDGDIYGGGVIFTTFRP